MSRVLRTVLLLLAGVLVAVALRPLLQPVRIAITPSETVPLGARAVVRTRRPATLRLTVAGRDGRNLTVDFDTLSRRHEIPVLGLYPGYRNRVEFLLSDERGRVERRTVEIETEPLPKIFPTLGVERKLPAAIAPGMTFLHLGHYDDEGSYHPLTCAVDEFGRVRWFYTEGIGHVLKRLENGNLLIHRDDTLVEMTMLGEKTGKTWHAPTGIHHDAIELPDGNILALSSSPGSFEDGLIEFDRESGEHLRYWDLREILDPERPLQPRNLEEADWLHLNGIAYDPTRDTIILSGRDQSAVVGVGRFDGRLRWILGAHDYWGPAFLPFLLTPEEKPFDWTWGQHAPAVDPQNPDRILVYDNGNKRSYTAPLEAEENYSRAVEYELDLEAMTVRQLWEYGREYGSELYTPFIGDANYLSNGNRLICFGGITRDLDGDPTEIFDFENEEVRRMKISARIVEVTGDSPAQEVMTIRIEDPDPHRYRGYRSYRAVRMSLYPPSKVTGTP